MAARPPRTAAVTGQSEKVLDSAPDIEAAARRLVARFARDDAGRAELRRARPALGVPGRMAERRTVSAYDASFDHPMGPHNA